MCNNCDCQDFNLYTDKNGDYICENDVLLFDNSHYYRCVVFNSMYCLKCLSADMPLLLLDKICVGKRLYSARIIRMHRA